MKKSKLVTTIGMLCLSAAFLASCSGYVKSKGNVVLIYNGEKYTAEELYVGQKTTAAAEAKFNAVYKVAVRNYFKGDDAKDLLDAVKRETQVKVAGQKSTASSNADKNGTSYDTEWQKILDSNKVDDEQGLYDKFEYEIQKEKFEDRFYEQNIDKLRSGGEIGNEKIEGYLNKRQPYHVKQILIKISGAKDKDVTRTTITEAEAIKISDVIRELAEGKDFADVALRYSDDTATKEKGGDLGIMDRDTSFVNDFKLGLYLYESYFGTSTSKDDKEGTYQAKSARNNLFGLNDTTKSTTASDFADKISKLDDPSASKSEDIGIGQIPYDAAAMLGKGSVELIESTTEQKVTATGYADIDFTKKGFSALTGVTDNAVFYPRNVIFNKYFNKHNVMVITPSKLKEITKKQVFLNNNGNNGYITPRKDDGTFSKRVKDDDYQGTKVKLGDKSLFKKGFSISGKNKDEVSGYNDTTNESGVLRDNAGRVILVFRSGNGTGDGSYQGIHFVVVERSPFIGMEFKSNEGTTEEVRKNYGVSLDEYYTNYYPGQEGGKHPSYKDGNAKDTYVSYFKNMEKADLATRANDVKTKIKGYNPNLNTYIYNYLVKSGNIKFVENDLGKELSTTITNWIDMKREKTRYDEENTWNENWETYYNSLNEQNKLRKPENIGAGTEGTETANYVHGTITEACAIAYSQFDVNDSTDKKDLEYLFGNGGVFHE